RSTEHARKAARMLAELGVLDPWSMPLEKKDQLETGLSKVNETRLNSISGEELVRLRDAGALAIAYAQLLSMRNIENLARLAQLQGEHAKANTTRSPVTPRGLLSNWPWHAA